MRDDYGNVRQRLPMGFDSSCTYLFERWDHVQDEYRKPNASTASYALRYGGVPVLHHGCPGSDVQGDSIYDAYVLV